MTNACMIEDNSLPRGEMHGYTASGSLIVIVEQVPVFKRILGTADDETRVAEWRISKEQARACRIAALWMQTGYQTEGVKQ